LYHQKKEKISNDLKKLEKSTPRMNEKLKKEENDNKTIK
jgi:hypothetical protein